MTELQKYIRQLEKEAKVKSQPKFDEAYAKKDFWSMYMYRMGNSTGNYISFLKKYKKEMPDKDYWEILRSGFEMSEDNHLEKEKVIKFLSDPRPGKDDFFMSEEEKEYLSKLPETVTVYRGCVSGMNEDGLSWTFDRKIADKFSKRWQRGPLPKGLKGKILKKTIKKSQIMFVLLSRDESEVIL